MTCINTNHSLTNSKKLLGYGTAQMIARAHTKTLVTKRYPVLCHGRRKNVVIISSGCPHTNTLTHPCTSTLVRSFIELLHTSPHNQNLPTITKRLTLIIMEPQPQHKSNTGSIGTIKQHFQAVMTSQYVSTSPNCPPLLQQCIFGPQYSCTHT